MHCSAWLPALIAFSMMGFCKAHETKARQCLKIPNPNKDQYVSHRRLRRGWIWKQFFVPEEDPTPRNIGQLKSDFDKGNFSIMYILSGEGAGDVFRIDEDSGEIYTMKKLDREKKAFYILRAQAIDRRSMQPVEPESEFIIKVQDINDNVPEFQNKPYVASVPEMCPTGTTVMQVTATDADDPSYGNSARLIYSILQGQPYFSVEPKTGIIVTSWPDLDREAKEQHLVIVQVKDMVGQMGGFSSTATVTINLSDVNDNGPKFQHKLFSFSIPESASVGTTVGRIMADDSDVGLNAKMNYTIEEVESTGVFAIITDASTQEGVIILQQPLDYESKRRFVISVEAINSYIDTRFLSFNQFRDKTIVKVMVVDVDEPPIFNPHEYVWDVLENAAVGAEVGRVSAADRDAASNPIRYYINRGSDMKKMFKIDLHNGTITIAKSLDWETARWHILTVSARETSQNYLSSEALVTIKVTDVNDNAPQLSRSYSPHICEGVQSGELIEVLSATDADEAIDGHHLYFSLVPEKRINPNFTLRDNQDNTAGVLTRRSSFSRKDRSFYYLPIVVADSGTPALTSTTTLTIKVCSCYPDGNCRSGGVEAFALSVGLSVKTLIAIASCLLIIIVLPLLILAVRRHKKKQPRGERWEEVAENVMCYTDKGNWEEESKAFDPVTLRTNTKRQDRKTRKEQLVASIRMSLRRSFWIGPEDDVFRQFILERLFEADTDPCGPPFDCLQTFAFEGTGSLAGSLSSLESCASEQNYDYLSELGPLFKRLAHMYVSGEEETDF
ncbi:cadherin-7 [Amia ocellicauda]|uniref:cadherin-7 n=1 Tax=Amia ocellicauda TaxID=2972642 RepID=UPI003464394F